MGLLVSYSIDKSHDHAVGKGLHCLLATFRSRQASDPRDKAFALGGIASSMISQKPHALLAARYDQSVLNAYSATARYCLEVEQLSDILCSAGLKVEDQSWPSWIADWSAIAPPHARLERVRWYETLCSDDYVFKSRQVQHETPNLVLKRFTVPMPSFMSTSVMRANSTTLLIQGVCMGDLQRLWTPASSVTSFDALHEHFERACRVPGPYCRQFYDQCHEEWQESLWPRELATDVQAHLRRISMPKALGIIQGGMPVYGPSNMRVGDFVAMVHGCAVPLVFRHLKPRRGPHCRRKCHLVGECYVHELTYSRQVDESGHSEGLDKVAEWFEVSRSSDLDLSGLGTHC